MENGIELYHAMVSTYEKIESAQEMAGAREKVEKLIGEMRGSSGDNHKKNI